MLFTSKYVEELSKSVCCNDCKKRSFKSNYLIPRLFHWQTFGPDVGLGITVKISWSFHWHWLRARDKKNVEDDVILKTDVLDGIIASKMFFVNIHFASIKIEPYKSSNQNSTEKKRFFGDFVGCESPDHLWCRGFAKLFRMGISFFPWMGFLFLPYNIETVLIFSYRSMARNQIW